MMILSRRVAAPSLLFTLFAGTAIPREEVTVVRKPATDKRNAFYVSNRDPLLANPLIKLPVGSIRRRMTSIDCCAACRLNSRK